MNPKTLQTTLEKFIGAEAAIPQLEKFFADSKTRLEDLELAADLQDAKALTEITSLQTVGELAARRMAHARSSAEAAQEALNEGCVEFCRLTFHPLYRAISERVAEKIGEKIKNHFRDEHTLSEAVSRSSAVQTLDAIAARGMVAPNDSYHSRKCAERLLAAFGELENFETTHMS